MSANGINEIDKFTIYANYQELIEETLFDFNTNYKIYTCYIDNGEISILKICGDWEKK